MHKPEQVELVVLCLLCRGSRILLQLRRKDDWRGYVFPGGHVEPGESFVEAVRREMKEETGLTVGRVQLCGLRQFPTAGGRYLVAVFRSEDFSGRLVSSDEGEMRWADRAELDSLPLVRDFDKMLALCDRPDLCELQYTDRDLGQGRLL